MRDLTTRALAGSTDAQALSAFDALKHSDQKQDQSLKKIYALSALVGVGIQLLIADAAFFWYLRDASGAVPGAVMDVWLGATVVQVIGIILVITRYLFPPRGRSDDGAST